MTWFMSYDPGPHPWPQRRHITMHNSQLLGLRNVDKVDIRSSFMVVAVFAVITIISYVNELNK